MKRNVCLSLSSILIVGAVFGSMQNVKAVDEIAEMPELSVEAENITDDAEIIEITKYGNLHFDSDIEFSNKDSNSEIVYDHVANIILGDYSTTADNEGVLINENTITITKEGSYILSGALSNGQIIVETDKSEKVQLIFDNASITNENSAAVYVKQCDKVFVTLNDETNNTLVATINDEEVSSAFYSKDDLTFNGNGNLTVTCVNGNGISSNDDLVFTGGNFHITADNHGLDANNSIRVANGSFNIIAQKDGLHCEHKSDPALGYIFVSNGNFNLNVDGDGFDSSSTISIKDGVFDVLTGGGMENAPVKVAASNHGQRVPFMMQTLIETETEDTAISQKAFKATNLIEIEAGTFNINAYDDAIHSNNELSIYGGSFEIKTADDALHADVSNNIHAGYFNIPFCFEGIEGQNITINGGYINMYSNDDGINAALNANTDASLDRSISLNINGGTIIIDSNSEGDGVDSNGNLSMTGGDILISSTTDVRDTMLDFQSTGVISGGKFIATGSASGTIQNFGQTSTQCSIVVTLASIQNGNVSLVDDETGEALVDFTPPKAYQAVTISMPELEIGKTYTLTTGDIVQSIEMTSSLFTLGGRGGQNMMQQGGQTMMQPGGQTMMQRPTGQTMMQQGGVR